MAAVFFAVSGAYVYLANPADDRIRAADLVRSPFFAKSIRAGIVANRLVMLALRDGDDCQICRLPILFEESPQWLPSLDHVIPRAHGGVHEPHNWRLTHAKCNNDIQTRDCPNCRAGRCKGLRRRTERTQR